MKRLIYVLALTFHIFISQLNAQNQNVVKDSHPGKFYTIEKEYPQTNVDGYNVYVPNSCNSKSKAFPVLVFLQGGLGVGGEVDVIYNWGLAKMLKDSTALNTEINSLILNTFVVVMPHISKGQFYENESAFRAILGEVISTHNVDKDRMYLTGLSRGGHGTWGLACRMPDMFAAVAPIAGSSHGVENYKGLVNLPMWVSHNTGDNVVTYDGSKDAVNKIEAISKYKFHRTSTLSTVDYKNFDYIFTSKESDSHNAWSEMYSEENFYKWLLKYSR